MVRSCAWIIVVGVVSVLVGVGEQGQCAEGIYTQIAADAVGVPIDQVRISSQVILMSLLMEVVLIGITWSRCRWCSSPLGCSSFARK
nr:molybdopterin cofactor-binding domain-containing protein [Polynucleobacter necessarius]